MQTFGACPSSASNVTFATVDSAAGAVPVVNNTEPETFVLPAVSETPEDEKPAPGPATAIGIPELPRNCDPINCPDLRVPEALPVEPFPKHSAAVPTAHGDNPTKLPADVGLVDQPTT